MARLQSKYLVNILHRPLEQSHRVERGRALVPALGEAGCQLHNAIEETECRVIVPFVQTGDTLLHQSVDRRIPGLAPDRPDPLLDRACRLGRRCSFELGHQWLKAWI